MEELGRIQMQGGRLHSLPLTSVLGPHWAALWRLWGPRRSPPRPRTDRLDLIPLPVSRPPEPAGALQEAVADLVLPGQRLDPSSLHSQHFAQGHSRVTGNAQGGPAIGQPKTGEQARWERKLQGAGLWSGLPPPCGSRGSCATPALRAQNLESNDQARARGAHPPW